MPLQAIIRAQIAQTGPISVADYMALCLTHPQHGYYINRDPLGAEGDFTTAPEVSQMFGEMIGLWLAHVWQDQGRPVFVLAELGPGRGTLMVDILRVAGQVPGFRDAAEVWLVEAGAKLRDVQRQALGGHAVRWADQVADIPSGRPVFAVANEFLDALPIRQFVRDQGKWRERRVGIEGDALGFGLSPAMAVPDLEAQFAAVPDQTLVEWAPAGEAVVADLAERIADHGGAALMVDYGDWDGTGDTLQAMSQHAFADPLDEPGQADLTTHVRFAPLAAQATGLRHSFATQGAFLERLGITARAERLATTGDFESIAAQHRRLTHPDEMGKLFKVLALTPEVAPEPPGFA
ncbi:class I SAM-dependent methyltransferase [Halovulum sp. GXIMD14793]